MMNINYDEYHLDERHLWQTITYNTSDETSITTSRHLRFVYTGNVGLAISLSSAILK